MEEVKMRCEICRTEFHIEYFSGGYIDHMNLVNNRDVYAKRCDIDFDEGVSYLVNKIIFHSSLMRDTYDIRTRLECVMKWDCLSDEVKKTVESIVMRYLDDYKHYLNVVEEMKKTMPPLMIAIFDSQPNNDGYREHVCNLYREFGIREE